MDQQLVKKISQVVYRRFPEMDGKPPKVIARSPSKSGSRIDSRTFLLTYNTQAQIAPGKAISRWVRVVADELGRIIKITTSR
jgi:hypothetical protein